MGLPLAALRSFLHLSAISDDHRARIFQIDLGLSASGELAHGIYHNVYGGDESLSNLFNMLEHSDQAGSLLIMNGFRHQSNNEPDLDAFWELALKKETKNYFVEVSGLRKSILGKAESYEAKLRKQLYYLSMKGKDAAAGTKSMVIGDILSGYVGYELYVEKSLAKKYPDVVDWIVNARAFFGITSS